MPLVRPQIFPVLYGIIALYLSSFYFLHYPVPGFFLRVRELGVSLFFLGFTASLGKKILNLSRLSTLFDGTTSGNADAPAETKPLNAEELLWSVGVGAALTSLCVLALGLLRVLRPGTLFFFTILLTALCRREARTWWRRLAGLRAAILNAPFHRTDFFSLALFCAVFALAGLCALAPPTYYDSLVYHLALPAKYLREGRVGFVPYNHYSHFPQNMELIYTWFLALGDDVSAQLFNVFLMLLLAATLCGWDRQPGDPPFPRWGIFLFLTAPCVVLLASETYVEVPLAFWTLLALRGAATGLLRGDRRWLILSGLMGGFATGIKYTGVMTPVLLSLFLWFWPGKREARRRVADGIAVALPAFLIFLPWLVKNFVFTGGNPVFPFLPKWFPAKNVFLYEESSKAYFHVLDEYKGTSSLLVELFQIPFRLFSNSLSFGGGYDVTGDLGWALPLLLFPAALTVLKKNPARQFLFAYVLVHGLLWASLRPVLRFLFPIFPAVCLLSGMGCQKLRRDLPPWGRRLVTGLVILYVFSNGVLFYVVERVRDPFPAALGLQTREEYLGRKIDAYPALRFIDRNLPAESRILFVGDQRGYYCPRPYVAPMALLPQPLRVWTDQAESGQGLRNKLVKLGFTHVFFHRREAERLKSYHVLDLTANGRRVWEEMIRELPKLYETDVVTLYALPGGTPHG